MLDSLSVYTKAVPWKRLATRPNYRTYQTFFKCFETLSPAGYKHKSALWISREISACNSTLQLRGSWRRKIPDSQGQEITPHKRHEGGTAGSKVPFFQQELPCPSKPGAFGANSSLLSAQRSQERKHLAIRSALARTTAPGQIHGSKRYQRKGSRQAGTHLTAQNRADNRSGTHHSSAERGVSSHLFCHGW